MWIPGFTTRESGNVVRTPSEQGNISASLESRSLLLAPQYVKYGLFNGYLGDILTVQKTNPMHQQGAQVTTIDVITKQDLLPRTQLSDIIARQMAGKNG